jgi:hypothetical protein
MATKKNTETPSVELKPRLYQYRVGSIIEYHIPEIEGGGFYQIVRIDKLKNTNTYAVHFWKVGTPDPSNVYRTNWNGAHQMNEMLDKGVMRVASY